MAARVRGDTEAPGVKARDTAERDTPACSATSRNVTGLAAIGPFTLAGKTVEGRLQSLILSEDDAARYGLRDRVVCRAKGSGIGAARDALGEIANAAYGTTDDQQIFNASRDIIAASHNALGRGPR